ncbi:MAG: hypothetical protein BYD32DRAFT_347699, partial [Podila humilis]
LVVCRLRIQAFRELDRMFTYNIMIRANHRLVTTGPYKYLCHPAYTGYTLGGICYHMLVFYEGLWDAIIYPRIGVHLPAYVALAIFGTYFGLFSARRIHFEEVMLSDHFGKEWLEFASKRWKIVPFVY